MGDVQLQLQTGFIDRIADTGMVSQRITDGYFNATAMCKAAGKQINDYNRLSTTQAFIQELSSETGIPVSGLIQSIKGGQPQFQGTWVHPQVAINLAQWLSPKFAVLVSKWVLEWSSGAIQHQSLPYHLWRYMANMSSVPYGYFSMLNEVTISLIGPLEQLGYTVSASMIPDISLGRTFSKHLRGLGYPVDTYPKYPHLFEDGRIVEARERIQTCLLENCVVFSLKSGCVINHRHILWSVILKRFHMARRWRASYCARASIPPPVRRTPGRQAEQYKIEQEAARLVGEPFITKDITLEDWASQWLAKYKKDTVRAYTYQCTYDSTIRKHIIPKLGKAPLSAIRPVDIQGLYNTLAKDYSQSLLDKVRLCLRTCIHKRFSKVWRCEILITASAESTVIS